MFSIGVVCWIIDIYNWIACLIVRKKFSPAQIPLSNRFDILSCDNLEKICSKFDEASLSITNINKLNATYHRLGFWNVQGLNCTHKQVEISEIMQKNNRSTGCTGELGGGR